MRIREIRYTSHFIRSLKRLGDDHRQTVRERTAMFKADCFDPRLKTHKLKGKRRGYRSFSLTERHRVIFVFVENGATDFLDVGDHSVYE